MKMQVSYNEEGQGKTAEVNIPDECPSCGRLIVFPFNGASLSLRSGLLQTTHICTFRECLSYMICYHRVSPPGWELIKTEPARISVPSWPDFVSGISSEFVSIYREAAEAESRGLTEIAGPGYRKAFEFLIKDYAKRKADPSQAERIEKLFSGNVVNEFISDGRVQAVAKRALWIGNDETHYLRKWENKDIGDLKTLIRLTIEWVDIEQQSAEYIEDMPES